MLRFCRVFDLHHGALGAVAVPEVCSIGSIIPVLTIAMTGPHWTHAG